MCENGAKEGNIVINRAAPQRAAIRRLTEALANQQPADDTLQIVVEEVCHLADATARHSVCWWKAARCSISSPAAGENAAQIVGLRIRVANSLSESVVAGGQPVLLDARNGAEVGDLFTTVDARSVKSKPPNLNAPETFAGARSAAVVPIVQDGRLIGTLSALNKQSPLDDTPAFNSDDLDTLAMLAEFAALARTVDRTARTAREQARELAVLYDAARTVSSSLNVQEVMESVLTAICTHVEYHNAILFLLNDERTHLFIAAERSLIEEEARHSACCGHGHSRARSR